MCLLCNLNLSSVLILCHHIFKIFMSFSASCEKVDKCYCFSIDVGKLSLCILNNLLFDLHHHDFESI